MVMLITMALAMLNVAADLSVPPPRLMTALPVVPTKLVMPPEPTVSVPDCKLMTGSAAAELRVSQMALAETVPLELSVRLEPVLKP